MGKLKPAIDGVISPCLAEGVRFCDGGKAKPKFITPIGEIALPNSYTVLGKVFDTLDVFNWLTLSPEMQALLQSLSDIGLLDVNVYDVSTKCSLIARVKKPTLTQLLDPFSERTSGSILDSEVSLLLTSESTMLFREGSQTTIYIDQKQLSELPFQDRRTTIDPPNEVLLSLFQKLNWTCRHRMRGRKMETHDALFHLVTCHPDQQENYGRVALTSEHDSRLHQPWKSAPSTRGPKYCEKRPSASLADVLADRRSCRNYCSNEIDRAKLSNLCTLALRQRSGANVSFPYPSAGGLGEMAIYLAISSAENPSKAFLATYDPEYDILWDFKDSGAAARETLSTLNALSAVTNKHAPCGIILAADYDLMSSAYRCISYANLLRNVGAIYQTVSLAAEALDLASCAVGGAWGHLETGQLRRWLGGRLIVGGMVLGKPG